MIAKLLTSRFQIYIIIAVLAATFSAGWFANGYLLGLKHDIAIGLKDREIERLDKELALQNAAVNLLGEQRKAAVRARDKAEAVLKDLLRASAVRQSAADKIDATNCNQMLEELKRIPR